MKYTVNKALSEKYERLVRVRFDLLSVENAVHPSEIIEPSPADILPIIAESLTPLFFFFAKGAKPSSHRPHGTLDIRCWIFLYALRPDLLNGESMSDFAVRLGITKTAVHIYLKEFREIFPSLPIDTMSRKGHASDKSASNERKRLAAINRNSVKGEVIRFTEENSEPAGPEREGRGSAPTPGPSAPFLVNSKRN